MDVGCSKAPVAQQACLLQPSPIRWPSSSGAASLLSTHRLVHSPQGLACFLISTARSKDAGAEISVLLSTTLSKGTEAAQAVLARVSLSDFNRASQSGNSQPGDNDQLDLLDRGRCAAERSCDCGISTSATSDRTTSGIGHINQKWWISAGVITYDQNKSDNNAPWSSFAPY
jgi:hypothetical protein